jgi:hypothetical protein
VRNAVAEFYRCPDDLVTLSASEDVCPTEGYFQFGPDAIGYGQFASNAPAAIDDTRVPDLSQRLAHCGSSLCLPFDTNRIVDNLRFEHYPTNSHSVASGILSSGAVRRAYYHVRPMLPDRFRRTLQRLYLGNWDALRFPNWPVDTSVELILERVLLLSMAARNIDRIPFIWFWPDGATASAMVTHDVETAAGADFVPRLMDIDDEFDIKASFQIVPEQRYPVSRGLLGAIRERQCEVNVHGLNHDGDLYRDRSTFLRQSRLINRYVEEFGAQGFRSACMYRNLSWYDELSVSYDMSVPNVAHLEPQRGGCCSVFPFFVGRILELPLTTVQDYSLFHILRDYSIELWKKQIEVIASKHGLISFIVHPDYVLAERELSIYKTLLAYLSELRENRNIWIARPGEVNRWWRERSEMKLVSEDGVWRIEGRGQERARLAYARVDGDRIVYSVERSSAALAEAARL